MEELNVFNDTQEGVVDLQVADEAVEVEVEEQAEPTESAEDEVATSQEEEAESPVQSKEENSKFADIRRKYEAEKADAVKAERDKLIAEMYGESHGIKTYEEYQKAVEQAQRQEELQKLKDEGYSDEHAEELFEARKLRAEKAAEAAKAQEEQERQAKVRRDSEEFLAYFEAENGRPYDAKTDSIPAEVWSKVNAGTPLKYAYIEHQMAEIKKGQQVKQKNLENAEANIGNVKGDAPQKPLRAEDIDRMSDREIADRWNEVKQLFKMK